ncbi:MAG: transaldolase [Kiloniellales bacterium]
MPALHSLSVKIFADGADLDSIMKRAQDPLIKGFTTNPTLMRKAGVSDYEAFARKLLRAIPDRPISFEVFADDFGEMAYQARTIASWGDNVYVKIPVTSTRGEFAGPLIERLTAEGVAINVTAILSLDQVRRVIPHLALATPCIVSVFAGRVADTGVDPVPLMAEAVRVLRERPNAELLWASPREVLNVFHAEAAECHIITATDDILDKLPLVGRDLEAYSLETVRMFHRDAAAAGYGIAVPKRAATG